MKFMLLIANSLGLWEKTVYVLNAGLALLSVALAPPHQYPPQNPTIFFYSV